MSVVNGENMMPNTIKKNTARKSTAKKKRPRKSLVAGEARRDRFQHLYRRKGTGRTTTTREVGVVGQKVSAALKKARKDEDGFDDLDDIFNDDDSVQPSPVQPDLGAGSAPEDDDLDADDSMIKQLDFDEDVEPPMADDEEPEPEIERKVTRSAKKTPKSKQKAASSGPETKKRKAKGKSRRQTLVLIENAKRSGLLDGEDDAPIGVRRSKRMRVKPLEWYKSERINYDYTTGEKYDGKRGIFLPMIKEEEPILPPSTKTPPPRPRQVPRVGKKRKNSKFPVKDDEDESDEDGVAPRKKNVVMKVFEKGNKKKAKREVAKLRELVEFTNLRNHEGKAAPKASQSFSGGHWTSGVVQLPPQGEKRPEVSMSTELFYVASCAGNGLQVSIGDQKMVLSRGDSFMIPSGNEYSLRNRSKKRGVTLSFTLVHDLVEDDGGENA